MDRKEILKFLRTNYVRNRRKLEYNKFFLDDLQLLIAVNNKTNRLAGKVKTYNDKVTLVLLNQIVLEKLINVIENMDDESYLSCTE